MTDVLGQVTSYTWSTDVITCIKPPGYAVCKVTNTYQVSPTYSIATQTFADGAVWTFSVPTNTANPRGPEPSAALEPNTGLSLVDPAGKGFGYAFSKASPYTFTDANGHATGYRFTGGYESEFSLYSSADPDAHEGTLLTEVDFPEGNKYLAEYGGPFNSVTKQTWVSKTPGTPADAVIQLSYSCPGGVLIATCTQPVTRTDPKGNVTNHDYFSWGGTKSEMQPAPSTGAARPLKLYDYVQKYAYIKNSGGSLVAAATPVWVPNTETICQTVAGSSTATCDTGAPITVTTYEYGANGTADNLLVRGKVVTTNTPAGAPTLRTCYGYDAQSNKIWETSPRAGLGSCP